MENEDRIVAELKQINITLSKIASILSSQAKVMPNSTNKNEIEDRIRQARLEAEERISKLKMRSKQP